MHSLKLKNKNVFLLFEVKVTEDLKIKIYQEEGEVVMPVS